MKKIIIALLVLFSFGFNFVSAEDSPTLTAWEQSDNSAIADNPTSNETTTTANETKTTTTNTAKKLWNDGIKKTLLWLSWDDTIVLINEEDGFWLLVRILKWFKDELFSLISLLAVAVFIFIGARLLMSKWNPEEFKKAMMHFVYATIWIFIIFMSWWLVKIVSTLSL